jgi:3',5'-cyclic AMP phosphodiesterase CpdA
VTARVLHLSDLHIGRREAPEPMSALRELAAELAPELLLATGDLAHRGKRWQFERAAELLQSLGIAVLAIPGNHDIPYTFPARFTRTFAEWEHVFGTTEPVYTSDEVMVVGLNSVRVWRQQGGALDAAALDRVATTLDAAPEGALRVVALHHHLAAPPWRARRKRPLHRRDDVLRSLAEARVELVVGGHVHQAGIAERREFQAVEAGPSAAIVLATAPGLGRPRPQRSGEARGVNFYESDADTVMVTTYAWDGKTFTDVSRRSFRRR